MFKNLSIIFSTRKIDNNYINHLKSTVGINNIEVLAYENNGEFSLTELYNKGLQDSINDIVVFIHDDLIFENNGWGKLLLTHFNNSDYGILGVAGTTDLSEDGRWWTDQTKMIGSVKHESNGKRWLSKYSNDYGKEIIETAIVDGLFIAVNRELIKENFDEMFSGFHYYDIPFCVRNHVLGVKVGVIFNINLVHKSVGQTNQEWEDNRIKFTTLYNDVLPVKVKVNEIKDVSLKTFKIKNEPKVTVIIPTKDKLEYLFGCIDSIVDISVYKNYEILIADTGSSNENKVLIKDKYKDNDKVKLIEYDFYNFAKINNLVVKDHVSKDTELLLFCNNDIKLVNDSISRMVNIYLENKKTVGTIGARLHFVDNSIQHSSIIAFILNHQSNTPNFQVSHYGLRSYYNYIRNTNKNVFGNTGAFLMINKELFETVGMFNEGYIECFEDVELNIQTILSRKQNMFVGEAVCYHYESVSRNDNPEKLQRLNLDYQHRLLPLVGENMERLQKYMLLR